MSQHILPASANLLGMCFLILSLKKPWKGDGLANFMDKPDGVSLLIFLNCQCAFLHVHALGGTV